MAAPKKPSVRAPRRRNTDLASSTPTNGAVRSSELIVNVANRETRIALLEDGKLMEFRVEREERVVGSIFKGIVVLV